MHGRLSEGLPVQLLQSSPKESPLLANPSDLPTLCWGLIVTSSTLSLHFTDY